MAPIAEAFVRVRAETRGFASDLQRGVNAAQPARLGERHGRIFGGAFARASVGPIRGIVGVVGGPLAAAFAAVGAIKVFSGFIADARESAVVGRLTAQVIKSTGGAAKVTASQVDALAQALSNKTGIDDETIQSGENLLLTFTGIRNEVGKGNDVFNRASAAVIDMTAALNNGQVTTDGVKSASIQLGKALNDPIKGVTALRKVGVSFTQQQTDQIKKLVESGHTLEAQKIILAEVGREFGGAAAAAADPLTRLRTILGNVGESIGTLLLPVINTFANWVAGRVVPAINSFMAGLSGHGRLEGFAGALNTLGLGLRAMVQAFQEGDITSDGFVGQMEQLGVTAQNVFEWIKANAVPALRNFVAEMRSGQGAGGVFASALRTALAAVQALGSALVAVIGFYARHTTLLKVTAGAVLGFVAALKIANTVMLIQRGLVAYQAAGGLLGYLKATNLVKAATLVWAAAQRVLNFALAANPIGLVIVAVAALVGGLIIAYKTSATFRNIVNGAFSSVLSAVQTVVGWIRRNWPLLLAILTGPVGAAVIVISRHFGTIRHVASALVSTMGGYFVGVWNSIQRSFLGMISSILTGFSRMLGAAAKLPGPLGAPFRAAKGPIDAAKAAVDALRDSIGRTKGKTIGITADLHITGTGVAQVALSKAGGKIFQGDGGIVKFFANGGENHQATIARAGTMRVWAEPETGGEAYIPLAQQKRPRSTGILRTVAEKFGYGLTPMADGGITYPMTARGTAGIPRIMDQVATKWANYTGAKFKAALERALKRLEASGALAGPALAWAKSQVGKPYVWGGVGPGGYDCSGFLSAILNVIQHRNPYSRRFSTGTLPAGIFSPGIGGGFSVGWFTGNPGHTAGTLNGVNVESAGGVGVRVGGSARGATNSMFNRHGHLASFARGGIFPGDPPFDLFHPRGRQYIGNDARAKLLGLIGGAQTFDSGGWLPPHSATLAVNRTREWEPVGARTGPTYVTINMPPGSDGADVVRAIQKYEQRNGKNWRN